MEKEEKINLNKEKTGLLIKNLENKISDEMILNSFIRDINILDIQKDEITIKVNSLKAKKIINNSYLNIFNEVIKLIFNKKLKLNITTLNKNITTTSPKKINILKKNIFDNYVECDFNREVIKMAKQIVKKPGKFSPFFITAKSGLGKTHLLHAIGNEVLKNNLSVIYIEPNKFTKNIQMLSRKGGSSISDYADSFKEFDFLLFDDIQNLGDRSVTLRVLLEIINNQINNEKQIVIVSDKLAQELSGFESRFITRFVSGISSTIKKTNNKRYDKNFKIQIKRRRYESWRMRTRGIIFYSKKQYLFNKIFRRGHKKSNFLHRKRFFNKIYTHCYNEHFQKLISRSFWINTRKNNIHSSKLL